MENEQKPNSWLRIMIIASVLFWVAVVILAVYANGLRVDNIKKNKENYELRGYKQAWLDFNRSFIPSTALPRLDSVEAYIEKGK